MSSEAPTETLSKQEKGRLKKLRKRANVGDSTMSFSGITDIDEYKELQALIYRAHERASTHSSPELGVSVNWKKGSQRKDTVIQYASHRDLIAFLTKQVCENFSTEPKATTDDDDKGATPHKRKRGSNPTTTKPQSSFEWASIHNKAMLQQLCVIEIQWRGDEPLRSVACRIQQCCQKKQAIVVPTQWFQSNAKGPQDMTEALMYHPPQSQANQNCRQLKKQRMSEENCQESSLFRGMFSLRLTKQQMRKEQFPYGNIGDEPMLAQSFREVDFVPSAMSQTEAVILLSSKWVTVSSTAINSTTDYVCHRHMYQPRENGPLVFALDCEMVETSAGTELGRATLCQLESYDTAADQMTAKVVFDVFVRPQKSVVDYRTKWSGLTAKILNDSANTVSLEQVQACLMQKVHPQDILVGHSLENDLHSLRWIHPTVVDTAILFRRKGRNTSKCSLKFLARQLLKKSIQAPDKPHCSEEDALTALELAVRRTVDGDQFDVASSPNLENWFSKYSEAFPETTFVGIASNKWLQKNVVKSSTRAHAIVTSTTITAKTRKTILTSCTKKSESRNVWTNVVAETLDSVEELLSDLTVFGVLVVALQCEVSSAKKLTETKRLRQSPKATLRWTDAEETKLQETIDLARNGYVVYISQDSDKSASVLPQPKVPS